MSSPAPPCLSSPPSFQGWDISPSYGGGGAQTSNPFSLLGCCAGALANSSFVPALCVLPPENWNGYQVAHLRGLRAPGKVNLAGERLRACRSTAPWEGHGAPSEKSTKPREAHLSSRPPTSASTFRRRRRVFQDRGQARSLPRSPCPSAQNKVRSKWSHCRSTRSCLNVISVDRTWRGLNLSCRQTLVRLRPS